MGTSSPERNVLSSPLAVFDDFLQASDALRAAVGPFLSGRRAVPYEDGVIAVDCVTLLTLNPRAKGMLEQQTTLNPAVRGGSTNAGIGPAGSPVARELGISDNVLYG